MEPINYDFELILTCKRYNPPSSILLINKLREVWAERCSIDIKYVLNCSIAFHLIDIAEEIYLRHRPNNLSSASIVVELSPANDWKYKDCGDNFWDRVLLVYASALCHTEVDYIDGLNNYFNNVWKKAGKP